MRPTFIDVGTCSLWGRKGGGLIENSDLGVASLQEVIRSRQAKTAGSDYDDLTFSTHRRHTVNDGRREKIVIMYDKETYRPRYVHSGQRQTLQLILDTKSKFDDSQ